MWAKGNAIHDQFSTIHGPNEYLSSISGQSCRQPGLTANSALSDLQPRLFEVEVAFDAVHHLVADPALVAQLDQGGALRSE